jgi:thiosulfate dehydrogenase (quinone) large subunit
LNRTDNYYNKMQLYSLVFLRVLIGWHFLYEGLVKVTNPNWSSAGFLSSSKGFMSDFFIGIALNPSLLWISDFLNMWLLTIIGFCLILGLFEKYAIIPGLFLLALYYLATPPFIGLQYNIPFEGSYLIVNKTLIEFSAMLVLFFFPTSRILGFDRLIYFKQISYKRENQELVSDR